ncbi:MAG: hypothetical protein ACT4TC_04395 [Myxococcaceae bacterium]
MKANDNVEKPEAFAAAVRAYEWGRARWAFAWASPVLLIPFVSWAISGRTVSQMMLGAALFVVAIFGLWHGQGLAAAVPLGLKAGLVPLGLAHAARLYGHVCTPAGCTSLCVPACVAGGMAAGLVVAFAARRSKRPHLVLAGATTVALLTGGLGCACVGYSGLIGMTAGLAVTLVGTATFRRRSV